MSDLEVGRFFDRHAKGYHDRPAGLQHHHAETAREIERGVSGRVLSVGGIWARANRDAVAGLTVSDLSIPMLQHVSTTRTRCVQADALGLPFGEKSFDHVVLPLVVHHVAGRSAAEARANARAVVAEAARVCRAGGRVWISELCPNPWWALGQRLGAPLVRAAMERFGQPFVFMHPEAFYIDLLGPPLWTESAAKRVAAPGARPWDPIYPVIGLPALRIPRYLFPLRPVLFVATRAGAAAQP